MTEISVQPRIEESWRATLLSEFEKPYFAGIKKFLLEEKHRGAVLYPPGPLIFNAFDRCPFDRVKVVILGQDPYHGPGQAHGLCFSVPAGVHPPPSLQNIFKELQSDLGVSSPVDGNLEKWAAEGVLLLNTVLTVEANRPQSHANRGWEIFTDAVIRTLDEKNPGLVFLLWGRPAQEKRKLIHPGKHRILEAPHPSPLSAHRGFLGCRHFSKANLALAEMGIPPVRWA